MYRQTHRYKASRLLIWATFIMYVVVCFTKLNYSASIAHFVSTGMFTKTQAGTISAVFYLIYAAGQLVGGKITDKISPYTAIGIGIVGCAVANGALCFTDNYYAVLIIWGLSAAAQFGVWPGASRIVADILIPEHKQIGNILIVSALAVGGFFSYSLASPILENLGWAGIFGVSAGLLVLLMVFWVTVEMKVKNAIVVHRRRVSLPEGSKKLGFMALFLASGLFIGMFLSFIQSMLDNGTKTWLPTMLGEIYHTSPAFAGVLTGSMYLINVAGMLFLATLYRRFKNEYTVYILSYAVLIGLMTVLQFVGIIPLWLVVGCFIASTTLCYSLGNMGVRIAMAFSKYGYSATVSGLWNAMASLGVVVASYAYGALSDKFGWSAVTVTWLCLAVAAVIIAAVTMRPWSRFKSNE